MIDLRTVKKMDGHFVEEALRHLYSDMLLRVRLKGEGPHVLVYVLVEHQSKPDYWGPLRVWQYILSAWSQIIRDHEHRQIKLPLIIPIIYYSGKEEWRYDLNLADLIEAPQPLVDLTLFGDVKLVDLHAIPDEELRRQIHLGVMNMALKQIFDEVFKYEEVLIQIRGIENWPMLKRFILTCFRYIFSIREDADAEQMVRDANVILSKDAGGVIMTALEKIEKRGEVRGEKLGLLKAALNMFNLGLDEDTIYKSTGLSASEIQELKLEHGLS